MELKRGVLLEILTNWRPVGERRHETLPEMGFDSAGCCCLPPLPGLVGLIGVENVRNFDSTNH